jgi:hypothetical protein
VRAAQVPFRRHVFVLACLAAACDRTAPTEVSETEVVAAREQAPESDDPFAALEFGGAGREGTVATGGDPAELDEPWEHRDAYLVEQSTREGEGSAMIPRDPEASTSGSGSSSSSSGSSTGPRPTSSGGTDADAFQKPEPPKRLKGGGPNLEGPRGSVMTLDPWAPFADQKPKKEKAPADTSSPAAKKHGRVP